MIHFRNDEMGTKQSVLLRSVVSPLTETEDAVKEETDYEKQEFPLSLTPSTLFDDLNIKTHSNEDILRILKQYTSIKPKIFQEQLVREENPVETEFVLLCKFLRKLVGIEVTKSGAHVPNAAQNRGRTCSSRKKSAVDLLAFDEGGNILPIEIHPFWLLDEMSASSSELCANYPKELQVPRVKHKTWIRTIGQIVGYMMTEQSSFGILMAYNFFYVLHCHHDADDDVSAIYITDRINCTDRDYLLKLVYVMLVAQRCTHSPPPIIATSRSSDITGSSSSNTSHAGKLNNSFDNCNALSTDEVRAMEWLGEGRCGTVFRLPFKDAKGVDALKLVDFKYPEAIRSLKREDEVYEKKKHLQGVLISRIIDHVSCFGNAIGLRMSYVKCLDDDVTKWRPEDKNRVLETLTKLAQHGLFQRDLEARHFGYDEHNQLVMFDLEDVDIYDESEVTESMVKAYTERADAVLK